MRIVFRLVDDSVQGGQGWAISDRAGKKFSLSGDDVFTVQGSSILDARLLAHDVIEHCVPINEANVNELIALGAVYFNRRQDFYNDYGDDRFASEIGEQVRYQVIYHGGFPSLNIRIVPEIDEKIDYAWDDIVKFIESESDSEDSLEDIDWDEVKNSVKAWMSRGYSEMNRLSLKYNNTEQIFSMLVNHLEKVLKACDYGNCFITNLNYKTLDMRTNIYLDDGYGNYRELVDCVID